MWSEMESEVHVLVTYIIQVRESTLKMETSFPVPSRLLPKKFSAARFCVLIVQVCL